MVAHYPPQPLKRKTGGVIAIALAPTSLNNLARLYQSQRRYEAAEPLYLEALGMLLEISPKGTIGLWQLAIVWQGGR